MKKLLPLFVVGLLLATFLVPQLALAKVPLVTCGNNIDPATGAGACTIGDFFGLIVNVYVFIVWDIATPLATLIILIGGLLMLLSGINEKWYGTGKDMVKWAIIAILIIWGAVLIIDTLFIALGYAPINPWNSNPFG